MERVGHIYMVRHAGVEPGNFHPHGAAAMAAVGKMTVTELWHRRLMHISYDKVREASRQGLPGIPTDLPAHNYPCHTCHEANAVRQPRPEASDRDTCDASFDLFDMSKSPTIGGQRYCTVIYMRKTRYTFVFLHKHKDDIKDVWTKFLESLAPEHRPTVVRCDNAGEYVTPTFTNWLRREYGIRMQNSNEHQQFQNGAAEKAGDTLTRRMRAGLVHSGLVTIIG